MSTPGARNAKPEPQYNAAPQYYPAPGYLRAFLTLLVVAHHAFLAYHPYAPPPSAKFSTPPLLWAAFPIVDSQRWQGIDLLIGFNDIFFMSLMFFLSGLFVWPSLARKGAGKFVRDRFWRLGLPFVLAAGVLAPLAYYPAYRLTGADPGLAAFWKAWWSLSFWPAGPAWFIWVLLAFGCLATALYKFAPEFGNAAGRLTMVGKRYPIVSFLLLVAVSAIAYLPLAFAVSPLDWFSFGPFSVQTSRILHYAVYFLAGIGVGACGTDLGLLAPDGKLARRWFLWIPAALAAFVLAIGVFIAMLSKMARGPVGYGWMTLANFTFVLSCAASSFALLAVFTRFARARRRVFDVLAENAYGIYLVHYPLVTWLQFALLGAALSGAAKGSIVLLGAVTLSLVVTAAIRREPVVGRII